MIVDIAGRGVSQSNKITIAGYRGYHNWLQAATLLFQRNLELRQNWHEAKVSKDPRKCNRKAQECSERRKERELAEEQRDACHDTGDHSIENTDTHVAKCCGNAVIGVSLSSFIGVSKMDNIINRESSNDSNEDALCWA